MSGCSTRCSAAGTAGTYDLPVARHDWFDWHRAYDEPSSGLAERLLIVERQLRAALDRQPPGLITAISMCAGQGKDLVGALVDHTRREDVRATLVELDTRNAELARAAAARAGLDAVEVVCGDASVTDTYASVVPANLILVSGVFGNISTRDITRTIRHLPQLCAPQASVIWTRHRRTPDLTPRIRHIFEEAGFAELAFEQTPNFGIGAHRLDTPPQPYQSGVRLFDFVGYDALLGTAEEG